MFKKTLLFQSFFLKKTCFFHHFWHFFWIFFVGLHHVHHGVGIHPVVVVFFVRGLPRSFFFRLSSAYGRVGSKSWGHPKATSNGLHADMCYHRISPCCPCWWVFLCFSISSPGDFISFPHLFDHFIKRIWSVFQMDLISLSQNNMFPTYLFILLFGFISCPKFSQSISPVDHYSLSSVLSSFPQPIGACYHWVSSVFPTYFLSSSWCFMSFGCPFLHCIIRFHQSSSPKSSLYHSFSSVFLPPTCDLSH